MQMGSKRSHLLLWSEKKRRCFENRTWRLQAEWTLWCCRLVIWAWSPSVTECLLLFCLSSSRTNHSGCAFLSSLTPTRLGAEKSSVTLPGPEMFLILSPEPPSSERMLEDFDMLFWLNVCNVLVVSIKPAQSIFDRYYMCDLIHDELEWSFLHDYLSFHWQQLSQSWCCDVCWRLNPNKHVFLNLENKCVDLCSSTRALNYNAVTHLTLFKSV